MQRLRVSSYFKIPELPVSVLAMSEQRSMEIHRHEFAELAIVTAGAGEHLTEQGSYPITAGDVFFIPPELPHGYAHAQGLRLVNVLFLPGRLPEPGAELRAMPGWRALFELEPKYRDVHGAAGHLRLPPDELARVTALTRALENECRAYTPGGTTWVTAVFQQLLVMLARSYVPNAAEAGRRLLAVEKVIEHIDENYAEELALESLAQMAGMSLSTFKRAFRTVTGTSPIDYVMQTRLTRACHLLRTSERNITDAALSVGFNDSNYFARVFRQRMGTTPREWRREVTRAG
ncbi:helix-turn-helix domain-containing protein [Opitutaceae bacterium TAV4]|uniref:helix-turn-helix domain-containing protein n=1 Tax=Geminisphaera colitermitum TaxID=1148786 RepID=UPI0005BAEDB1|nr:helix-turn-helix domain-containing protein [Geminisphaera colitermitum]RRJ96572.1 helix-turn-helix domain-containing protein [Opitutaceae bacterium TAV4]RRK00623.1 helix-turn-helix domain-containing protein [Opitutaceae bacterium TAV3]